MKSRRGVKSKWLGVLAVSLFLVAATVFLQELPVIRPDEVTFLKVSSIIRHNILRLDKKPLKDSVIFLNVSRDLVLINDTDRTNTGSKLLITDRKKLANLFRILNQHPGEYRLLLCDILIDLPAPDDPLLAREMRRLKTAVFAADYSRETPSLPLYSNVYGAVNYTAQGDLFTKLPLFFTGSTASFPSKLYQVVSGKTITPGLFPKIAGEPAFNEVIPEFYYRRADLEQPGKYFQLGPLLIAGDSTFDEYLKGKYIVVGDFERDMHRTYTGDLPGPLILLDTYLTIRYNTPVISVWWLIMLLAGYFFIAYKLILKSRPPEWYDSISRIPIFHRLLVKYVSFLGAMIVLSLLSLVVFNVFISIFYIATILTIFGIILERDTPWRKKVVKLLGLETEQQYLLPYSKWR